MAKVSELLATPEMWCQGHNGRDKKSTPVAPYDRRCVSRCLSGACDVAHNGRQVRRYLADELYPQSITTFNDNRTHAEVLALVLEAEAATEGGGR